jgi:Zn-dependent alcohol dehydrogenase
LYNAGKLNLDDMITKRYTLDQVNEAYKAMIDGDVARGVIAF